MCNSEFNAAQAEVNRCKTDLLYFAKKYVQVKEPNGTIRPLSALELSRIERYSSYTKKR